MSTPNAKKVNLRVQLTKKMLWDALVALLENRPFESLSVQEICDHAMVHRTTFYKHFEDKYHLLSYGLEERKNLLDQKNLAERLFHPLQTFESLGLQREMKAILHSENENSFLVNLIHNHAHESLMKDLHSLEAHKGVKFEAPMDVIASFYSGAISSMIVYWLKNHEKFNAKELDEYINLMISKDPFSPLIPWNERQ